jgi:bifunctional UDP-N-acetylglucosamine pyrophosphorylase/glucosamine-1-phosphate N-acetyltransferase
VASELNWRGCEAWQRAGVTIIDPANTYIDVTVELGEDVTLLPGTHLKGLSSIGAGATVGPEVYLEEHFGWPAGIRRVKIARDWFSNR